MPHGMETPADRMKKYLADLIRKFSKTKFAIPAAILISAAVYYLVVVYAGGFCLRAAITPVVLLALLWKFDVKSAKKLVIIGLVASVVFGGVLAAYYINYYTNLPGDIARSDETVRWNSSLRVLDNGTVTPLYGDDETLFNFTLTVYLDRNDTVVDNVSVVISGVKFPRADADNYTMNLLSRDSENKTERYYYATTLSNPVNAFAFWATVNHTNFTAGQSTARGYTFVDGPVFDSTGAIAALIIPISIVSAVVDFIPIYAIIVLMIWWTRKSRKMREAQLEKWMAEKEKKKAEEAKETKVPSLAKAMGVEKEDTFVCSECGADVPADATVCPKCGEKFE